VDTEEGGMNTLNLRWRLTPRYNAEGESCMGHLVCLCPWRSELAAKRALASYFLLIRSLSTSLQILCRLATSIVIGDTLISNHNTTVLPSPLLYMLITMVTQQTTNNFTRLPNSNLPTCVFLHMRICHMDPLN
jgi:hypothetical protein